MALIDQTQGYLEEVRAFADSINMRDQLEKQLGYLENYGTKETRCRLYKDFAPYSLAYVIEAKVGEEWKHWLTGAMIFHGPHDRGGDGGAPTYSVCLTPTTGWAIHS